MERRQYNEAVNSVIFLTYAHTIVISHDTLAFSTHRKPTPIIILSQDVDAHIRSEKYIWL